MNAKFIETLRILLIVGIIVALIGLYYEVMETVKPMKLEYELNKLSEPHSKSEAVSVFD